MESPLMFCCNCAAIHTQSDAHHSIVVNTGTDETLAGQKRVGVHSDAPGKSEKMEIREQTEITEQTEVPSLE